MIAYLKGKLVNKEPTKLIVEVHGIGYEVNISLNTYSLIKEEEDIKLVTYLHIREDAQILFGFATPIEKEMFLYLIEVNGIGTSTALLTLSYMTPTDLRDAIISEQVTVLQKIKGIGGKTAQRMVLELKDKLRKLSGEWEEKSDKKHTTSRSEALSALTTLGINKTTADKALDDVLRQNPQASVENLIKLTLKNI